MMQKDTVTQDIDIELSEDISSGEYANLSIISHSTSEFVIDFARVVPGVQKARVNNRVILAPEHAKRLMLSLQDNITRYEAVVGRINLPYTPSEDAQMTMSFGAGEA